MATVLICLLWLLPSIVKKGGIGLAFARVPAFFTSLYLNQCTQDNLGRRLCGSMAVSMGQSRTQSLPYLSSSKCSS